MASTIPKVAAPARQAVSASLRAPLSRRAASFASQSPVRAQIFSIVPAARRQYATAKPHYDPGPPSINKILEEAEPHTPQDWQEIGQSALEISETEEERAAVKEYIINALKPKLADDEIIMLASHSGVALTTPEELAVGQKVFKAIISSATMDEAITLFKYFEKEGEFPPEIKKELHTTLTGALAAASAPAAGHDGHSAGHDDHHHAPAHGAEVSESFGIGWWLTLGAIPFSYIIYQLTRSKDTDSDPFLTRLIHKYDSWKDEYRLVNELHTTTVEQAGYDRLLFQHSADSIGTGRGKKDIRFVDSINQGAPINVSPSSIVNLEKAVEKMKERDAQVEDERLRIQAYFKEKESQ